MIKFLPRRAVCAGLVVMGLSTSALMAQSLSTGLGQAWPNAQDLSTSSHWHVYAFTNNGVKYVQVNDLYGNIRTAFAVANGQFLVLPMGRDAQRLSTPQQPLSGNSAVVPLTPYAETVYRDGAVQVTAVPMSDGTTSFAASPSSTNYNTVSPCNDPENCSGHLQ